MKTDPKILASFLAAAVWADGEYDEFEKEFVADLAEGLEVPTLNATLEAEIKATENMDEDALANYLETAAKKVTAGEKEGILSLCLQLMCACSVPSLATDSTHLTRLSRLPLLRQLNVAVTQVSFMSHCQSALPPSMLS